MYLRTFVCSLVFFACLAVSSCAEQPASIGIMSMTPVYGSQLKSGDVVPIRVLVTFRLVGRVGLARLFVQQDGVVLGSEAVSIFGREGTAVLETSVTVPESGELTASVALFEQGQEQSMVTDRAEFQVASRESAL